MTLKLSENFKIQNEKSYLEHFKTFQFDKDSSFGESKADFILNRWVSLIYVRRPSLNIPFTLSLDSDFNYFFHQSINLNASRIPKVMGYKIRPFLSHPLWQIRANVCFIPNIWESYDLNLTSEMYIRDENLADKLLPLTRSSLTKVHFMAICRSLQSQTIWYRSFYTDKLISHFLQTTWYYTFYCNLFAVTTAMKNIL